ncbi:MAG TPA: type II CAAX endopeptidase family protein [Thermoanaerobaculia bacterium]|jgi:membrane protease YdiL (CAAX protease family)
MSPEASVGRRVGTYLVLTFAFSFVFYFLIIRAGNLGAGGGLFVAGLMWSPAAAAIVASLLTRRRLSEIGWRWSWPYAGAAYVIPVLYGLAAYGATWALGLGAFPNRSFVATLMKTGETSATTIARYVLVRGTLGVVLSLTTALGEEIGWRGFLVPELARRMPFARVALVSGAIWSLWHYPVLLFANHHGETPAWYRLICFTVMVLGISFVFAWIRLASGSVWPAAILHASHNLWIQSVFDPLTADTGRTAWVIGEFGAALAIAAIVAAALVTSRGRSLSAAGASGLNSSLPASSGGAT